MMDIGPLTTTGAWRLEEAGDGIAFLVFDLPGSKLNVLTSPALEDLGRVLEALAKEKELRALIVRGGKEDTGTFIAGADIREIRAVSAAAEATAKARRGQEILGRFASLPALTVAAIHGNCLGGGTELALACDLRIASHSPRTRIGLPEVNLGILPGFGGTQRLPRLVGLAPALPVILGGQPLDVARAARIGLVDRVVYPALLLEEAKALAGEALARGGKSYRPRRPRQPFYLRWVERLPPGRAFIRWRARRDIKRRAGSHYPAPYRALDAVVDGFSRPLAAGLALEASLVGDLAASRIAKNLIDLFLAGEEARRGKGQRPDGERAREAGDGGSKGESPAACAPRVRRAAVLGAGVMGGGIAALFARKGFRVRLKDIHPAALQAGLAQVHEVYSERLRRGRMTKNEMQNSMAAITCTTGIAGLGGVEVVVEAVVEDLAVKKAVLREIEAVIPPTVLFASNTSSLSIGALQAEALHPERLAGLHFFNPVEKMPLVEVVRGARTSETALEAAESLARELGKVPVRVADGPGFLVNRLLAPYLNEAVRLLEEGYSLLAIDRALVDFGMPMGPFALLDEIGLDVAAKVGRILEEALGERLRPPALIGRLQDLGARGKKNGKGFYVHGNGRKTPNPAVLRLGGTGGSDFKHDEAQAWLERLLFPMINEAALALEAGIVERPALVDLAMVMGTGFPPFRGGPLRFAEALGLDRVLARLQALAQAGVWKSSPAPLLARLVAERRGFYPREEGSEALGETAPQADAVGARA